MSSVLPFNNIYVCTKFNFNPFSTFQRIARINNHYEKKWLMGDNSVIYRVMCTALPITAIYLKYLVSFQSLLYFPRYGPDMHPLWTIMKKWLRGDNSINRQGRIKVLGFCHSPHSHLSIYQVSFKVIYRTRYRPDRG